jgi:hypothetical protein
MLGGITSFSPLVPAMILCYSKSPSFSSQETHPTQPSTTGWPNKKGLSPFDPPHVLGEFGSPPDVQNRVLEAPLLLNPCVSPLACFLVVLSFEAHISLFICVRENDRINTVKHKRIFLYMIVEHNT